MTSAATARKFRPGKPGVVGMAALILSIPIAFAPVETHAARPFHFIGPMLHWNYGGGETRFSIALEGSYWFDYAKTPVPMGFDYALEWETSGVWRIYSEAQVGALMVGYGAGPVLEFGPGRFMPGLQGTVWGNTFFGVDFRGRLMAAGPHSYANGVYFKAVLSGDGVSLVID